MKFRKSLRGLGLVTMVGVAVAASGSLRQRLECLNITLRLNDNTYCPNGRMTGREGRTEGRDDRMRVYIVARTTGGQEFRIRRSERARLRVTCYEYDKDKKKVGKVVARSTYTLRGRFTGNNRRILCAMFKPPKKTGNYLIRASLGGTTVDSTTFGVWYDKDACPRPRRRRRRAKRPRPPPAPTTPPAPPPSSNMAKCLAVTLNVSWTCQPGGGTARVTVRNTHASASIPVNGIGHSGIGRLGAFERTSGPAVLGPGQTAVYTACGNIHDGTRTMRAWVSNLPDAKDSSNENVACGPNWDDLH